ADRCRDGRDGPRARSVAFGHARVVYPRVIGVTSHPVSTYALGARPAAWALSVFVWACPPAPAILVSPDDGTRRRPTWPDRKHRRKVRDPRGGGRRGLQHRLQSGAPHLA